MKIVIEANDLDSKELKEKDFLKNLLVRLYNNDTHNCIELYGENGVFVIEVELGDL